MTPLLALIRKEFASLFGSPTAYLTLTMVALVTSLIFFDHLRLYNQILFVFASSTMGGFESDTIPDHINLRDTVFNPVMDQLSLLLIIPIPLVTMRVFAEERSRGTDEWLVTTGLSASQIVLGKFAVTLGFIVLMMTVSFIYPASSVVSGGLGLQHLLAVFLGLVMLAIAIASIGLACSAFTSSQIIAAATTVGVTFLLYDFGWTHTFVGETLAGFLDRIALHPRYGRFSEGLIYLEDVTFFLGFAVVSAAITRVSFEFRRVAG